MSDNKDLWKRAFTTDPRAVKPITGKTYKGNSPKPYWLIERATDEFGPIGIGWGVTVKSERFERLSEHDVLHVAVVSVWYVLDGKRSETFDQMGGTKAAYWSAGKDGAVGKLIVDEDAGKKSVTDGMVKCLSMIGFAGDIFSGMWDDSKYVQWAADEWDRRYAEGESEPEDQPKNFGLTPQRATIVRNVARAALQLFNEGDEPGAYGEACGITDNEEKLALWSILKPHSALRSAIKRMAAAESEAQQKLLQERKAA